MVDFTKQDMTDLWASSGDKTAPSSAKITAGWIVEAVPRQWWNWFENRQDTNIAYMLQKGIPEWDIVTEYVTNKSYVQRNNVVYKAILTGAGQDPATATTYWVKAFPESSASLEAIRTLTPAADKVAYYTSGSAAALMTVTSFARTILDDTSNTAVRTTIGAQASHANLTALSGPAAATNTIPYFNTATTMLTTPLTAFGRSLMDDADATAGRATLGLTSAAITPLMVNNQDRTAGAIMPVGAFGLGKYVDMRGSVMSLGTPADIYGTGTSFGFVNGGTGDANSLNIPGLSGPYYGTLQVNGQFPDASGLTAMSRVFIGSGGRTFTQTAANATTWTAWVENWTTGNLAKTTSNRDTTAGRLMQVGDFGLGNAVVLADAVDLNTVIDSGFYRLSNNPNLPPSGGQAAYGQMIVIRGLDTIAQQVFVYNPVRVFTRTGNPTNIGGVGVWQPWVEMYHTGNTAALTTTITNDVLAQVTPTTALKLDKFDYNLSNSAVTTSDPNTDVREQFVTNHANTPFTPSHSTITQVFYASKTSDSNRSQIAIEYNPSGFTRMAIRSYFQGVWGGWIRCDQNANTASANKLNVARLINGVAFDGTSNINVPVYAAAGSVSEIGRYLDFHGAANGFDFDCRLEAYPGASAGTGTLVMQGASMQVGGNTVLHAGNVTNYAAGAALTVRVAGSNATFNWSGQGGQPTWLWGGNDPSNFYVYNPSNFSVNYANSCNYANSAGSAGYATSAGSVPATQCVHNTGTVEFGAVLLTGANVSTVDLPNPYVMTGMRTGSSGPHGAGWLRGVAMRTS